MSILPKMCQDPVEAAQLKNYSEALNWHFDVSTFKLLGRELITDRITAVFELIKNCYDANAEEVTIEFCDAGEISEHSKVIIKDNGIGMSPDEITNNWMVIGTSSKRKKTTSEPPYNRVLIGEKGIGRFAVEKLGSKLLMRTKKEYLEYVSVLEVDWDAYEEISNRQPKPDKTKYFTDIDNRYRTEPADNRTKGTELIITNIREPWTEPDLERLYKELSKLIYPFETLNYPFRITIKSNEYEKYSDKEIGSISVVEFAAVTFSINYDIKNGKQEVIKYKDGKLVKETTDISQFGPVKFNLYYFDQSAKKKFNRRYPKGTPFYHFIDGIKIYRDGIITTPFAEYEAKQDNKRDVLGIDKRRYSGFFNKVNSRDIIGIVEITKKYNPKIIDSTNR
ncbi:ATP-binding protein, partial [Desulfococcaceae bacterium HSG8]|nr:ATP-binding protein [Desulfococcaceae bacterium HSG8]